MDKIKIGYKTYDIIYDDGKLKDEGLLGQIQYDKNLIRLRDSEEKYNKFIEEVKQDDEKLLKFVRAFLYLSFDESVNGIKKIKKDSISKYIDFEYIENSDIFNEVLEYFR